MTIYKVLLSGIIPVIQEVLNGIAIFESHRHVMTENQFQGFMSHYITDLYDQAKFLDDVV